MNMRGRLRHAKKFGVNFHNVWVWKQKRTKLNAIYLGILSSVIT